MKKRRRSEKNAWVSYDLGTSILRQQVARPTSATTVVVLKND